MYHILIFSTYFLGRVLKVDGAYAAVKFPFLKDNSSNKETKDTDDSTNLLQDCRLMKTDDLQVLKSNSTSRSPDCFQRTPKKVNIPENAGQIMSLAVDGQGIFHKQMLLSLGLRLEYCIKTNKTINRCSCHCKKWAQT